MSFLRWIHKSWTVFLKITGIAVLVVFAAALISFAVLQLKPVKNYITGLIEKNYAEAYLGVLTIDELSGVIPFNFVLHNVKIYPDSVTAKPAFTAAQLTAHLDILSLLQREFVVTGLTLDSPFMVINEGKKNAFLAAITRREEAGSDSTQLKETPFFEIFAPNVVVKSGRLILKEVFDDTPRFASADSLTFDNINLAMFFEYKSSERFIDIDNLTMAVPELDIPEASVYGQVYNNSRFLEFNAFNFRAGDSYLRINGRADGIDVLTANIGAQFEKAELNLDIEELVITPERLTQFVPELAVLDKPVLTALKFEGNLAVLQLNQLILQYGNSGFEASGEVKQLLNPEALSYNLVLKETTFDLDDIKPFLSESSGIKQSTLSSLIINADVEGDLKNISGRLDGFSDRGSLLVNGVAGLGSRRNLDISFISDSLDVGGLFGGRFSETSLSSSGLIRLDDYEDPASLKEFKLTALNSSVDQANIDLLNLNVNARDNVFHPFFTLVAGKSSLEGSGTIDLNPEKMKIVFSGSGSSIALKEFTGLNTIADARADLKYEVDLSGTSTDDITGKVSIELPHTVIGADTLQPHLLYTDITGKEDGGRLLRLTSTAFDATLDGFYTVSSFGDLAAYWYNYFSDKLNQEILFNADVQTPGPAREFGEQDFSITAVVKDIGLVHSYFPEMPAIESSARFSSDVSVNGNRLLFNGDWYDNHFEFNETRADSLRAQITGSFRYNENIKDFSAFEVRANAKAFESKYLEGEGFGLLASLNNDSLRFNQVADRIGKDVSYRLAGNLRLSENSFTMQVDTFNVGSSAYSWVNKEQPQIRYTRGKRLFVNDFTFENSNQQLSINGVYSEDLTDSLSFRMKDIELGRISELINGDIDFAGTLNGSFVTRTLTSLPSIEGRLDLTRFVLGNDTVGNLLIESTFNQPQNRFDTAISLRTTPEQFPDYYKTENREGQDLRINGYIAAPGPQGFEPDELLFDFDVAVNSVDLWFVTYLAPKVFHAVEGQASGNGRFWGNLDTYDFDVDFSVGEHEKVFLNPVFLETDYYVSGPVNFTRKNGLVFKDIAVSDGGNGKGVLNGFYNFNDFSPPHNMDLRLRADRLQLLNSEYDIDSPVFGDAFGTGTIRMHGTNLKASIETSTPIVLTAASDIRLPLLEETQFDSDSRFIRFVREFDEKKTQADGESGPGESKIINPADLTFGERFTLDMQFVAEDPMTVQLIFDPVTGEVIKSNGTGRIRIRMEDQDLSVFGKFSITGGSYQFVSGDIFTRRFTLEPGGSIVWEGAPGDAGIDLNAVFSARPDIQTLVSARSAIDPNTAQRVPVDLVLHVGGSLTSIQNDFYFRLPVTFESLQSTTLATQINALNQNEEEKLLQATSFLLLESFIPSKASGGGTETLTGNLTTNAGAAVLNPLISSQLISPLLSNQMNSLLRSDISSFDVDFSLNAYNQIDLGVALRLYNDRLIISREGQISGANSNIGDLGATYRMSKVFSITAFHRRDPMFSGIENGQQTQQAQDINGVGIEAVYSFDSWKSFMRKIIHPFKKLFGIKEDEHFNNENAEEPPV